MIKNVVLHVTLQDNIVIQNFCVHALNSNKNADLGADHLIPVGGLCFFVKFSKYWKIKINSLFSYLWEKNSLFMK